MWLLLARRCNVRHNERPSNAPVVARVQLCALDKCCSLSRESSCRGALCAESRPMMNWSVDPIDAVRDGLRAGCWALFSMPFFRLPRSKDLTLRAPDDAVVHGVSDARREFAASRASQVCHDHTHARGVSPNTRYCAILSARVLVGVSAHAPPSWTIVTGRQGLFVSHLSLAHPWPATDS